MPFDFEALVGHLYVVGGRAVSVAPPGALVEVAPKKAARGREADTFFTLVLPSGDALAPTAFYEQMSRLAAERYFDSTGSVTAGLREVFTTLNENLVDHNQSNPQRTYEANIVCAVLRSDDLIIGRVGSAVVLLRHEDEIETLPPNLENDEALYVPPLGVQPIPEMAMTRHRVTNGTRMVMGDANMADFSRDQIERVLSDHDIGMMLVGFKELARLQLTMVAVEYVPPEVSAPMPVPEGESTAAIAEEQRAKAAQSSAKNGGGRSRRGLGKAGKRITAGTQRSMGVVAQSVSQGMDVTAKTLDHYLDAPDDGKKRWYTSPLAAAVAVLIPVAIVAVVLIIWLGSTGETEFEICINNANDLAELAREVESSNPSGRLTMWNSVMEAASNCAELRPEDQSSANLIREGQEVVDIIFDITRREAIPIEALPEAMFTEIILAGRNIYVLDSARARVYQMSLSEDGLSITRGLSPILAMSAGTTVDNFPIGNIIDIGFSSEEIFALDENGVLIVCRRNQTQNCEAEQLRGVELWQTPIEMTVWGTDARIYILDPGANQIWRYVNQAGSYSGIADQYFEGQNRAQISQAVDLSIDDGGNVYVLRSEGLVVQYTRGVLQDFRYGGFSEAQMPNAAQSMFLDEDPLGQAIYLTNRDNRTIYELTLGGSRRAEYRIFNEDRFSTLNGVVSNPGNGLLYAISGNTIFALQIR